MGGGGPPALRGQEEKERVLGSSRPSSFSFHIHKFLNIKQEELVEDEVQEYKVGGAEIVRKSNPKTCCRVGCS